MQAVTAWIKRHVVTAYFALTFIISWGGVLLLGSPYGMPTTPDVFQKVWLIVFLPYFFGPLTSSLLLTGIIDGRSGFRELGARLRRFGVGARWYAIAVLAAPLLVLLILLPLSLISPDYVPAIFVSDNRPALIAMGVVVGLVFGGFFEELGWTGFAVPRLRQRHSTLVAGTLVGALWAVWHLLPTYWGTGDASGVVVLELFLPPCVYYIGVLPAYRVLMVAVHDRTNSLPVVMIMHAGLTASTLFVLAPAATGMALAIYYVILTALTWAVVAWVVSADRRQVPQMPSMRPV